MKKYVPTTLFLLLVALFVQAQDVTLPVDRSTKKITFSETISFGGAKKDALYNRAVDWGKIRAFKVTALKKAEGIYGCTGAFKVEYPGATAGLNNKGTVQFDIKIVCKNGSYTYTFTNFRHLGEKGNGNGGKLENDNAECGKLILPKAGWNKIKSAVEPEVNKIIQDMKLAIGGN